jgi:chromosome segregation ATPase
VQSELVAVVSPERLTEIDELRNSLDATRHELGVREQQFTSLQETVDGLRSELANAPARVASLEAELIELREFRKTVNEFMTRRPQR